MSIFEYNAEREMRLLREENERKQQLLREELQKEFREDKKKERTLFKNMLPLLKAGKGVSEIAASLNVSEKLVREILGEE